MFDKSRGGDETRHKYLTHSEWHTDSKFVGLLKVGYQASILEIKFKNLAGRPNEAMRRHWTLQNFGRMAVVQALRTSPSTLDGSSGIRTFQVLIQTSNGPKSSP